MSVKLLSNTIKFLVGLLKAAVAARTTALDTHAQQAELLLYEQRQEFLRARTKLELQQADKAIQLYKSLDEAKKALKGIQ
jgi:hypothetical protein